MNELIPMEEPDPPEEYDLWLYQLEQDKLKHLDKHLTRNLTELENDMRIGEMKESNFLKKEEVGRGKLVTIKHLEKENVAPANKEPEEKFILYFEEYDKGLVLNWTNIQLIAQATGAEDTDNWVGKQIVLYEDPNVSFGGKLVGGIRVRAPRPVSSSIQQAEAEPKPGAKAPVGNNFDDDIPF